ncbi:MAG: DNA-binding protein [Erysipelotrichaceae bacterium]|nr:DNA-binding protein [Erysipelotrichaceae bacterium]
MPSNREYEICLFDYYGDLLTSHQKEILQEYYYEDLSMNEIAENYEISKSAVQDLIKRCLIQLNEYENKLNLIRMVKNLDMILEEMRKENNELLDRFVEKIEKIK